jgi:microcystin-dependent protein
MSRVKTFDATGVPPGGRLFAGDLNSIQDKYADAANFAQTVDLGTLRVGDSTIQLVKFGTGDARVTAALRVDGILRGLGGLFAGAFTTAQRDAIAAGFRPFTLIIFNTTTNRFEWNAGTDAVPNWQPVANTNDAVPLGSTMDWPWRSNEVPANYLLPYGQAVSRTTYAALHALASAAAYPWGNGDGSTTFNLPDYRGRVGVGKDDMGGTAINRVTTGGSGINGASLGANGGGQNVTLATGELPIHNHGLVAATITGAPALAGSPALSGSPSLSGSVSNGSLSVYQSVGAAAAITGNNAVAYAPGGSGGQLLDQAAEHANLVGASISAGITQQPAYALTGGVSNGSLAATIGSLAGTIGTLSTNAGTLDVGGTTDNAGSGTAHNNMMPSIVVNKIMRVL